MTKPLRISNDKELFSTLKLSHLLATYTEIQTAERQGETQRTPGSSRNRLLLPSKKSDMAYLLPFNLNLWRQHRLLIALAMESQALFRLRKFSPRKQRVPIISNRLAGFIYNLATLQSISLSDVELFRENNYCIGKQLFKPMKNTGNRRKVILFFIKYVVHFVFPTQKPYLASYGVAISTPFLLKKYRFFSGLWVSYKPSGML